MAKLIVTTTKPTTSGISTSDPHIYLVKVQNDFDYTNVIVGATDTTDAALRATNEYFRRVGLQPNSATVLGTIK